MTCNCVEEINEKLLRPKGEQIDLLHEIGEKARSWAMVRIVKSFGGRGRCSNVVCNYCPFCGKRQEPVK